MGRGALWAATASLSHSSPKPASKQTTRMDGKGRNVTHFPNSVLDFKSLLVFHHPPLAEIPSNLSWRLQEALEKQETLLGEPYPELIQCLCQCLNSLHVQVICWLIQDVEVWTGREDSSQEALKQAQAGSAP